MQIINTEFTPENRRSSLAISALLNEVSIDPMQHPLAPNTKEDFQPYYNYSPISSGSSSPSEYSFHQIEPPDLWNHSRTGTHQTHNGNIVISSLTKAKRKRILPYQYERLIQTFEITDTPSSEVRKQLAEELDMTKREVQVWFQNRRAKMNRTKSRHHSLSSVRTSSHNEDNCRSSSVPYLPIKLLAPRKMTLEAPFQPTCPIDLLASAAEMMRQN